MGLQHMSFAAGIIYQDNLTRRRVGAPPTRVVKAGRQPTPRTQVFKDLWIAVSHPFAHRATPTAVA